MRALLPIWALLLVGCNRGAVSGDAFVTAQPSVKDVPGSYLFVSQSVTTNDPSPSKYKRCQLDLNADGTFSVTNFTDWSQSYEVSTTGNWRCEPIGSYHDRDMWGIRFDSSPQIEAAALSGSSAPYKLVMIIGDPDSDQMIIYEKKK